MKVITIESSAFTALTEQIAEIAVYVRAVSGERKGESSDMLLTTREAAHLLNVNPMESIRMFDNQDLCMLLQISKRTLQRYRSIGALPYKTLGKKTYYSEEDVLTFLSEHVKDFRKEDIAFYKARIHNFFNK